MSQPKFTTQFATLALGVFAFHNCEAHGFAGAGWLHPLTGLDHMLAMLCVGAWSKQLGGRALILVPASFIAAMAGGWTLVQFAPRLMGSEAGVAISVVLLGIAIGTNRDVSVAIATGGTALFGLCHGYSHGMEMAAGQGAVAYAVGFFITTVALHLAGAFGAAIIQEQSNGAQRLRLIGIAATIPGFYWVSVAAPR